MGELDRQVFLALNFDGGNFTDRLMFLLSGRLTWLPLYLLILFLIYRRHGWKTMLWACVVIAAAVGLADQACNFFKANLPVFRPNHTEMLSAQMHFPLRHGMRYVNSGLYGTVSAHAATSTSIAWLACAFLRARMLRFSGGIAVAVVAAAMVRRHWFTAVMILWVGAICYSRIYLGSHYPSQILFGIVLGVMLGWVGVHAVRYFRLLPAPKPEEK